MPEKCLNCKNNKELKKRNKNKQGYEMATYNCSSYYY